MWHRFYVWLKSKKLKNTLKRTRYRLYLWRRINGQEPAHLAYGSSSVSVIRPDESYVVHHRTLDAISLMFKASPNGRFEMDALGRCSLSKEDRELPIRNPFEKEEEEELKTLGRILTREERSRLKLLRNIDVLEEKYYREF